MIETIEYPKTYNPYKRDGKNVVEGVWSQDWLEYLQNLPMYWTEKIDGTNMRVIVNPEEKVLEIRGRSDKADIHSDLIKNITTMFNQADGLMSLDFSNKIIFFGEGFGPGIQKVGGNYRNDKSFICFDIAYLNTSNEWSWADWETVKPICEDNGIPTVPQISDTMTILEAIEFVRKQPESEFGNFTMEGLIGVPKVQLFTRYGERVKVKVKCCDFK